MKNLLLLFVLISFCYFTYGQGKALTFDGSNDYVALTGYKGITGTATRTVEAWLVASSQGSRIIEWGDGNVGGRWTIRNPSDELRIEVQNGGNQGSTSMTQGEAFHIAIVWSDDGTPNVEDALLYVNGKLETLSSSAAHAVNTGNTADANIGRGSVSGGNNYTGEIDEVRIWTDVRTVDEIRTNMHKTLSGSEGNLDAYFSFDNATTCNGTAGEIEDESTNTNDGTCTNMDNADIITSKAPVGNATVNSVTAHQNASVTIGDITFDDTPDMFDNSQDVYVSKIPNSPNVTTGISEGSISTEYYVINIYDNGGAAGTFSVSLTFTSPTANGNEVTLYSRSTSGTGSWSSAGTAVAASGNVTFTGISGFSQFILATDNMPPLAVELTEFDIQNVNNKAQLSWQTASEINNEGFEIEWSTDNRTWKNIGFVKGAGDSFEKQSYFYLHENPVRGVNYYRLKQMDYDGAFEYSDVVSVELSVDGYRLSVAPNPVQNGELILTLPNPEFETRQIELINSTGQRVLIQQISDSNTILDVRTLPKGIYWLKALIDGKQTSEKIIIQ